MILGTHQLKGSVQKLPQPFCVLEKENDGEALAYSVKGVITQKILFNNYPKTII